MSRTAHITGMVFALAFRMSGVAQDAGLPEVFIHDPQNNACSTPYFLEHSLVFNYEANTGGCCFWFAFRTCHAEGPGFDVKMTDTDDGKFAHYTSTDPYPDCDLLSECEYEESEGVNPTWSVPAGVAYHYIRFRGAGNDCVSGRLTFTFTRALLCPPPCDLCTPSFSPEPGQKYIVSAWAHQEGLGLDGTDLTAPKIFVDYLDAGNTVIGQSGPITASGPVIDGWQRMEQEITINANAAQMKIRFLGASNPVYYDDIRFCPADGSLKSYVYDPVNLRFVAELDERHYATFYEYDGEGKIARVKKETERGVMTIQETRYNSSKLSGNP